MKKYGKFLGNFSDSNTGYTGWLWVICIFGTLYHAYFLHLNEVLKVPDSFAYLQMSHFLSNFLVEGLGNGWFGFLYSLPIAILQSIMHDGFLAGKIVNLVLLNISAILLYTLGKKILPSWGALLVVFLFFLSPVYLHFSIHVLSENLYIPLFLGLLLAVWKQIELILSRSFFQKTLLQTVYIAIILAAMYLTRAEAFIYIISLGSIACFLVIKKLLSWKQFIYMTMMFFCIFFICIFPYLIYLHDLTGEWGLTNKGASNLRQAELRSTEKMDDAGFEQAVGELTEDKHHLIAGFAGGMPYDTPQIEGSLTGFIQKNPQDFLQRIGKNQVKLFTKNIPEIFLGKGPQLFLNQDTRLYHNIVFLVWCILPLIIMLYGSHIAYQRYKVFFGISIAFFLPAVFFFTLFFTLNRYFLIFLPLMLIYFMLGIVQIFSRNKLLSVFLFCNYVSILLLSTSVYANTESSKDTYYQIKQEAGEWLKSITQNSHNLRIMERFPIVTYYANANTRYITPYTDNIQDIYEYGVYNDIDILVVDTLDFMTYRPELTEYIENVPKNFGVLEVFENQKGQKVILYFLKK